MKKIIVAVMKKIKAARLEREFQQKLAQMTPEERDRYDDEQTRLEMEWDAWKESPERLAFLAERDAV